MRREHVRSILIKAGLAVAAIALVVSAAQMDVFRGERTSATDEAQGGESQGTAESGETEGSGTTVTPPFTLASALLTVADLPPGWTLEQRAREAPREFICGTEFDIAAGGVASPKTFFSKVPDGDYLAQGIVAHGEGGAAAALDRIRGLLDGCSEWTSGEGGSAQTWEVSPLDLPGMGDDMVAVRLTGKLGGLDLETTQLVIRRGEVLNTIAYVAGGQTAALLEPIARIADEKVAGALSS